MSVGQEIIGHTDLVRVRVTGESNGAVMAKLIAAYPNGTKKTSVTSTYVGTASAQYLMR